MTGKRGEGFPKETGEVGRQSLKLTDTTTAQDLEEVGTMNAVTFTSENVSGLHHRIRDDHQGLFSRLRV